MITKGSCSSLERKFVAFYAQKKYSALLSAVREFKDKQKDYLLFSQDIYSFLKREISKKGMR